MQRAAHAARPAAIRAGASPAAGAAAGGSAQAIRGGASGEASRQQTTLPPASPASGAAQPQPPSADVSAELPLGPDARGADGAGEDGADSGFDASDGDDEEASEEHEDVVHQPGVPLPQRAAAARAAAAIAGAPATAKRTQQPEALIGRRVRKKFLQGWFSGEVVSSRADQENRTRYYKIIYEDDDREEVELRALLAILLPADPDAQPARRTSRSTAQRVEEDDGEDADAPPPADALEYALVEALVALEELGYKRTSRANVTEYAAGLLPDSVRAAMRSTADMDAPLARAMARGWIVQDEDEDYDHTDEGVEALRAHKARGSAACAADDAAAGDLSAAERVKLLKRSGSGLGAPSPADGPEPRVRSRAPEPRRVRVASVPPPEAPRSRESLVGCRVREPLTSTRFREGVVESRDAATGTYSVRYDDPAVALRTGVSIADVRAIAVPKAETKKAKSRIVDPPKATASKRRERDATPPKAKAKAKAAPQPSASKKRRSDDEPAAKAGKAGKTPASVEAFLRSIQPPLSQLSSSLKLVPASGVSVAHLAQAAQAGVMQGMYVNELLSMLGVTAGPDRLAFIGALGQLAPQA